jgi:adenylate cyclase
MALRHPLLSHIWTQIIFWIFAFVFFFLLVNFISIAVTNLFPYATTIHIFKNILIAIFGAIIFGTLLGLVDFLIDRKFKIRSFGLEIFIKIMLYTTTWFIVGLIVSRIGLALQANFVEGNNLDYNSNFYLNMGIAFSVYTLVMIVVISFMKEMDNKFGPGIIIPMLLGKYRKPRVEERIFLFIDLKSSTMFGEKLGHLKYSRMIQNIFADVNKIIPFYEAEVYQYVGDEVVLTWSKDIGMHKNNCVNFFFAFLEKINTNKSLYEKSFGCLPEFKASAHLGQITVAEVGDIKREIAYHGDTINTASRIQDVCNYYKKTFLISEDLKNNLKDDSQLNIEFVDEPMLKGKTKRVKIYSVEKIYT